MNKYTLYKTSLTTHTKICDIEAISIMGAIAEATDRLHKEDIESATLVNHTDNSSVKLRDGFWWFDQDKATRTVWWVTFCIPNKTYISHPVHSKLTERQLRQHKKRLYRCLFNTNTHT